MKRYTTAALLVLLASCVPSARPLPPDTPIVYNVPYEELFSATLQELTAAQLPAYGSVITFSIAEANKETGLITAVHNERQTKAAFTYRTPDDAIFGLGLRFSVPVTTREQTVITIVLRPEGRGRASIIYSTQGPDGRSSPQAERIMRQVIAGLDERFMQRGPIVPQEGTTD